MEFSCARGSTKATNSLSSTTVAGPSGTAVTVSFSAVDGAVPHEVSAKRCDLTPDLSGTLAPAQGQYVDVLYLPQDVRVAATSAHVVGASTAFASDFRFLWELDSESQARVVSRSSEPLRDVQTD